MPRNTEQKSRKRRKRKENIATLFLVHTISGIFKLPYRKTIKVEVKKKEANNSYVNYTFLLQPLNFLY